MSRKVLVTDYVWPNVEPERAVLAQADAEVIVAPHGGEETLARVALAAQPGDAGGPVLDMGGAGLGLLLPGDRQSGRVLPSGVALALESEVVLTALEAAGVEAKRTEARKNEAKEKDTKKETDDEKVSKEEKDESADKEKAEKKEEKSEESAKE